MDFLYKFGLKKIFGCCFTYLKNKIYPIEQFKKDFSIDVSTSHDSVTINLMESNPEIRIGFMAVSKSEYLNITLDRMAVSLSFLHQMIFSDAPMLKACEIPKKGDQYVSFVTQINDSQKKLIYEAIKRNIGQDDTVSIDIHYRIESGSYKVSDYRHLEPRHCRIINKPNA